MRSVRFPMAMRRQPPPVRPVLITDGLLVTSDAAWAWYVVPTAATDWLGEPQLDAQVDRAGGELARLFGAGDLHLKILWGRLSASDYIDSVRRTSSRWAGNVEAWWGVAASRIDSLALPQRQVLLGVRLASRGEAGLRRAARSVEDAVGAGGSSRVGSRELAGYLSAADALARRLSRSIFAALPAPAELIAWSLSREANRTETWVPTGPIITGPQLARLLTTQVRPHVDCVELVGPNSRSWVATLVCSEFGEELEVPGGEWLLRLGEVDGCSVDFSSRLRILNPQTAIRQAREVEALGKEQMRSASAGRAGEPPLEITETVEAMRQVTRDIARSGMTMLVDDPRWVVAGKSRDELDAHVDAVIQLYGGMGIDLYRLPFVQRALWLEQLPGDRRRVSDFAHTRPTSTLAGSWFWGGSVVGDEGPYLGVLTGSTPGLFRLNLLGAAARGDATTTVLVGRSGRGKTTAMMMLALHAAHSDAWVTLLDIKGDCGGLVDQARLNGLPADLVQLGPEYAGVLDPFLYMAPGDAKLEAAAVLLGMLHPHRRASAEEQITRAVNAVARDAGPALSRVVDRLLHGESDVAREVGAELAELGDNPLAGPVVGRLAPNAVGLGTSRGLRVLQIPGVQLPSAAATDETWTLRQRLSVMVFRSCIGYTQYVGGSLREMPKVIAIPELHLITRSEDGRAFVDATARLGRALKTNLILDTQVAVDLARLEGVREQATTVVAFEAVTSAEQDAVAELLGLEPSDEIRHRLATLGQAGAEQVAKGHAVVRDWRGRVATVQWDLMTDQIQHTLSTSPPQDDAEQDVVDDVGAGQRSARQELTP